MCFFVKNRINHFLNMDIHFVMGLKPLLNLYFTNPFTEVNGNKIHLFLVLLPSALADEILKMLSV